MGTGGDFKDVATETLYALFYDCMQRAKRAQMLLVEADKTSAAIEAEIERRKASDVGD